MQRTLFHLTRLNTSQQRKQLHALRKIRLSTHPAWIQHWIVSCIVTQSPLAWLMMVGGQGTLHF